MFEYEINGKKYVQKKTVFIQAKELIDLVINVLNEKADIEAPEDDGGEIASRTAVEWAELLGDKFLDAVAIVLIPEGKTARERNIKNAVADLELAELDIIFQIVEDFFSLNKAAGYYQRVLSIMTKFQAGISEEKPQPDGSQSTGSESSISSPPQTLQK